MKRHEMKISFGELMEILEGELRVYGDFLKYFKIDLDLLPITRGTPLLKVGSLYSRLKEMHSGMLPAYVMLALVKKGFVHYWHAENDWASGMSEEEALEDSRQGMYDTIRDSIKGGSAYPIVHLDIFVNSKNPKEAICVNVVCAEIPTYHPTTLYSISADGALQQEETQDSYLYRGSGDDLIKEINKEKSEIPMIDFPPVELDTMADFIIIDPLLFKACKEEINALKQEVKEKIGKDIVCNPNEFLDKLATDRTDFYAEWENLRADALTALKEEYEFLVLYDEGEVIQDAKDNMRKATHYIETETYDDAVSRGGKACEGLLRALYLLYKKKTPREKPSFVFLLTELSAEISDDFGEDILKDLNYIKHWRNVAGHPNPQIKPEVALKVIRKAQLFQELFFRKMKGCL